VIVGSRSSIFVVGWIAIALLAGCQSGIDGRIARAYSLARHPSEANKNRIEALLGDEDRDVRATVLVVMGQVDKDRARGMALGSLADPDGLVRAVAVDLCAEGADAETIRLLSGMATEDPVWHVRARSLRAIVSSDEPAVRDAYVRALSDPVHHVRRAALEAGLGHLGLLPVDLLSNLVVSDTDWENRVAAAIALGASGDPAAYAGLEAAGADPNEFVRSTAARERRELERAGTPP
jgi:HEAT repeat protein